MANPNIALFSGLDADTRRAVNNLNKIQRYYGKRVRKRILRNAAKPLIQLAKEKAPVSPEPHSRWNKGVKVATYAPGNLKKSIGVLGLKRSSDIFVGPRRGLNEPADGYYGHFVEFGYAQDEQPYMRPAWDATKGQVRQNVIAGTDQQLKKYTRENAVR